MRIASLVPSATEMLFELGLGEQVVAVTHECDWPLEAAGKPKLTSSVIPPDLPPGEIDRVVRETVARGAPLYTLDREQLAALDPHLIVTQAVCEVCAVSFDDVVAAAASLPSRPKVLSLDPLTLDEVFADVPRLGEAADATEAAAQLGERAQQRLTAVELVVAGVRRPRVVALEWLDPPYIGGHWIPEMVHLAGGTDPLGGHGERSRTADWGEIRAAAPDVVVAMPCGYGARRSAEEARIYREELAALGAERVIAVDASSYFSRPGPRLVTGVELLAGILHPDRAELPEQAEVIDVTGDLAQAAGAP